MPLTSILLVLAAHVLRLGAGLLVLVVLARQLGPAAFGQFVLFLAVATLLCVPVNFGFGALVLRSFGVEPERALQTMGQVFTAKLVLGLGVVGLVLGSLPWIPAPGGRILALLLAAQLFETFAEFYTLGFRISSDFSRETSTASFVSAWHILVVSAGAFLWPSVEAAAWAFALSRATGMLVTRFRSAASMGPLKPAPVASVLQTLRRSWAYALELGLRTAYGQLDTLLINFVLGPAAVGLYQAGMKLVEGASRIAPVLAHAWLPELSRLHAESGAFGRIGAKVTVIFAGMGAAGYLLLWLGAAPITDLLFGPQYKMLEALLPWFGLILFLKFAETGIGLLLVAKDLQSVTVWSAALQFGIMISFGSYALAERGLIGWQWLNAATLFALLACCGWLAIRAKGEPAA